MKFIGLFFIQLFHAYEPLWLSAFLRGLPLRPAVFEVDFFAEPFGLPRFPVLAAVAVLPAGRPRLRREDRTGGTRRRSRILPSARRPLEGLGRGQAREFRAGREFCLAV